MNTREKRSLAWLGVIAVLVLATNASSDIINVGPGDSIQAAIDAALDGDEIIVAPGTYFETISFLGKAITVRSSDGPDVTIIDAQQSGTVVTCETGEGPDTVLAGFTITGGSAPIAGGGMRNSLSSPTVTSCTFMGNSASTGGGMFNESGSSPTVTACTFMGNSAGSGGAMLNLSSSPTVTGCTFSGNSAGTSGGGMLNLLAASPTVTNCTFSGNSAGTSGGGMFNSLSSPTVTNCILWGDSPNEIFGMFGTPFVTFSDVQGGFTGTGNIDADPMFVDPDNGDFRLVPGSPCIDAADNTAVPQDITTDLDGNPRFVDDPDTDDTGIGDRPIVDMGAYEFQGGLVVPLDIEPGDCPNEFRPRLGNSGHKIDIALVGTADFDVRDVDFSTILLSRADGVGGAVLPERVRVKDRATPFEGEPCGCHEQKKDGIDDLRMRFFAVEMTRELELDLLLEGDEVELILAGELLDGTPFTASDCVVIVDPPGDDESDDESDDDSSDDSDDDSSSD